MSMFFAHQIRKFVGNSRSLGFEFADVDYIVPELVVGIPHIFSDETRMTTK